MTNLKKLIGTKSLNKKQQVYLPEFYFIIPLKLSEKLWR